MFKKKERTSNHAIHNDGRMPRHDDAGVGCCQTQVAADAVGEVGVALVEELHGDGRRFRHHRPLPEVLNQCNIHFFTGKKKYTGSSEPIKSVNYYKVIIK